MRPTDVAADSLTEALAAAAGPPGPSVVEVPVDDGMRAPAVL